MGFEENRNWHPLFNTKEETELENKRQLERRNAEARVFDAIAYRAMPEDLRSRAREWGVEALMCHVWNSGFQSGYLQSARDRDEYPQTAEDE